MPYRSSLQRHDRRREGALSGILGEPGNGYGAAALVEEVILQTMRAQGGRSPLIDLVFEVRQHGLRPELVNSAIDRLVMRKLLRGPLSRSMFYMLTTAGWDVCAAHTAARASRSEWVPTPTAPTEEPGPDSAQHVVPLLPDVLLTLVQDHGKWRFAYWSTSSGDRLPDPSAEYLAHRFTSQRSAATFFRSIFLPGC
jgi:hypothetical protein